MIQKTNRWLLPIHEVPLISKVIDLFPKGTEFIISLGYRGEFIREYCQLVHNQDNIKFIEVGPQNHPNEEFYSAINIDPSLQKGPYHLFTGLGLPQKGLEKFDQKQNWYSSTDTGHIFFASINGDMNFHTKSMDPNEGLFNHLKSLTADIKSTTPSEFNVLDLSTEQNYRKANQSCPSFIFMKADEQFYRVGDKVIKFFLNPDIVSQRVERVRYLGGLSPTLVDNTAHFYSYEYFPGETLYKNLNLETFDKFLNWIDKNLWSIQLGPAPPDMEKACAEFYKEKTLKRINKYLARPELTQKAKMVNGESILSHQTIMEKLPWEKLKSGVARPFHGDLQFDNIVYNINSDEFRLLDWRQNFASFLEYGDVRYDLAKLLLGLTYSIDLIKQEKLDVKWDGSNLNINWPRPTDSDLLICLLKEKVQSMNIPWDEINIIMGLALINMAGLHSPKLAEALWFEGHRHLSTLLK